MKVFVQHDWHMKQSFPGKKRISFAGIFDSLEAFNLRAREWERTESLLENVTLEEIRDVSDEEWDSYRERLLNM